jgi:hypothetical protein
MEDSRTKSSFVLHFSPTGALLLSKRLYHARCGAEVMSIPIHRGGARETFFPNRVG